MTKMAVELPETDGEDRRAGPLHDLVVLDLSRVLAGPWASQMLGDLGAEIIKIEQPGIGDETRRWGPPFAGTGDRPDAAYYLCANRNKQSVEIDFAKQEGAALIRDLALQADILIENFRVGSLARHGLDYSALSALNGRLIYCSITGFGQTGPYASRGGYDFLVQGMSGLMSVTGRPDGEPGAGPMKAGIPVADLFTALYAGHAMLAALHHRNRTGEGQHIDCALLDTQLAAMSNQAANHLTGGLDPGRLGNAHPSIVPYRDFATRDGHVLVAIGTDRQFRAFCRLLGLPGLAENPLYATNAGRSTGRVALEAALTAATSRWGSKTLLAAMEDAGVPGGPINTVAEAFRDPQVQARGLVRTMTRADGQDVRTVGYPAILSRTPATYRSAPPLLGEHTAEILTRRLGLTPEDIAGLHEQGITGPPSF